MAAYLKKLALDTNLVLDLAAGGDLVSTFHQTFLDRGYAFFLPATAVEELAYLKGEEVGERFALADRAMASLCRWQITPVPPSSLSRSAARKFAGALMEKRLLASAELQDGVLLAEVAAARIPVLVSADNRLLKTDQLALHLACNEADLDRVAVSHPLKMLNALR